MSTDGGYWASEHLKTLYKHNIPLALPAEGYCKKNLLSKITILPLDYGDGFSHALLNTANINTIKVQSNLSNFDVQSSPYASEQMSNLLKINDDKESASILNKDNYILQVDNYKKNGNNIIISGNIDSKVLPTFSKNELTLIASQLPENNITNLNCTVEKGTENIYNLLCKGQPNVEYDFNNSILVDNDKILILNFAQTNSTEPDTTIRKYYKNSSGLKPGLIALVIIIPIVAVAAIVGLILFLRKPSVIPNQPIPSISTTENIKGV